ncbi:MAG: glutamine synthetase beta-grasp domain-containing protein [Melioribacteraceae bacterium]|nr:glutamine synthetase beta-grasp domain-containing protein [Melioribacteraceae bacterium]MCF8264749.1 glutamine synthetase beta-grasp domain-containing protein [Melioribacteraceae bacterium]MCF8431679.1 glutamine synthetase beta-grasp domain-containing protein [Melioribacteraceae bacterium]
MAKSKLEYIWLDGNLPTQQMRSKTKVVDNFSGKVEDAPIWSFDGSSTMQAAGNSSDLLLKPVNIFPDPDRSNGYLVMAEVLNPDGTPHATNARATIHDDDNDFWFGFEQEYVLWDLDHHTPYGFPAPGYYPPPQGPFYCSVGAEYNVGRNMIEKHLDHCIEAGINIEGINSEVMKGQWEYQIFAKGAKEAGDQIWIGRYLMERVGEEFNVRINLDPKPVLGDWNGSGMHANFSNSVLRTCGDKAIYEKICSAFGTEEAIQRHIAVYGENNDMRLTGRHETQAIDKFSFGVSDRGASIRIPIATVENGYKGWLEDRRPASNADPYKVAAAIVDTVKGAKI